MSYIRKFLDSGDDLLCLIVNTKQIGHKTEFYTSPDNILQMGCIYYPSGHKPAFHKHNAVIRESTGTNEVLYILRGCGILELLEHESSSPISIDLSEGDLVYLAKGFHRILPERDMVMIEVKNGPYISQVEDKFFIER